MGCGISATREDYHLIFSQKLSFSYYSFVYAAGEDNCVGLLWPTPDGADTLEAEIIDEGASDTMVDDILEAMEHENGQIYDESDSGCGEEHEMDGYTYSLYGSLEKNSRDKIYIWISEPTNGAKDLVEGNNIFYFRDWVGEGGCSEQKEDDQKAKIACKGYEGACFGEVCNRRGYMAA